MGTDREHESGAAPLCLDGLRRWRILRGRCAACGHIGDVDAAALRRRLGAGVALSCVEARLRCRECGNAAGNRLEIGCYPRAAI